MAMGVFVVVVDVDVVVVVEHSGLHGCPWRW